MFHYDSDDQLNLRSDGLYQMKVDVDLLNTAKNELADVSSGSPSSEQ